MATQSTTVLMGILIDEQTLSLNELACACAVEPAWLLARLEAGLIDYCGEGADPRFASRQLQRARCLLELERDFDANPELAALVVDLLDEVRILRARLRNAA